MRVTINENEEVEVGDDTSETYYTEGPVPVNDSVFKCSDCKTGTIHQGYEFCVYSDDPSGEADETFKQKRVYLCTNCGKMTQK